MSVHEPTLVGLSPGRFRRRAVLVIAVALTLVSVFVVTIPGARTARAADLTRFSIDATYGHTRGEGWTPGYWVSITIEDPRTQKSPDVEDGFFLFGDSSFVWFPDDFYPDPGDIVTVSNHFVTKTHVVTALRVTESDETEDTISGFVTPGATVVAWVEFFESTTRKWTIADGSGRRTFDLTGTRDLTHWDTMGIRELDGDGTDLYVDLPVDADEDNDGCSTTSTTAGPWRTRRSTTGTATGSEHDATTLIGCGGRTGTRLRRQPVPSPLRAPGAARLDSGSDPAGRPGEVRRGRRVFFLYPAWGDGG